jgi:cell division protease FtsH
MAQDRPGKKLPKINRWTLVLIGLSAFFLAQWAWMQHISVETISYSAFQELLAKGEIAEATVSSDSISGTLKNPLPAGPKNFVTNRVDAAVAAQLLEHGVSVSGAPSSGWLPALLSWIFPAAIFLLIWRFALRGMDGGQGIGSGLMTIGKSRAKVYVEKDIKVTFGDVAGVEEAKQELKEVVAFLKDPKTYGRLGARVPKGILLVGPPGTGKTLLARAVAGEAGVPFFSISGSEFVEMFVGIGAARVRDLFEQARAAAPCIIFVDELDALGRSRTTAAFGNEEKEQTLNQLLAELDGFDPSNGVILLAATNRPEILDPALLRAGRFDRQVLVDRPELSGRIEILKVHVRRIRLAPGLDLARIAGMTAGFTGADLANLVNEAAIAATRRNAQDVGLDDFTTAIERIVAGIEKKSRVLGPNERRRVAYHEMGHGLVAANLTGIDPVQKVSIIPRGVGALGYTMQRPTEDRFLLSASELKRRIAVLMGGRAAEDLVFHGDTSTGAADDLQRATEIAVEMVTRYGMNPIIGQRTYEVRPDMFLATPSAHRVAASELTAREVDLEVKGIVGEALATATAILEAHRSDLDAGAKLLLEKEAVTAEEFAPLRPQEISAQAGRPDAA